jgi:hypothetical protein
LRSKRKNPIVKALGFSFALIPIEMLHFTNE